MSQLLLTAQFTITDLPKLLAKRVTTIDPASGCWRVSGYHDDDGYTYFADQGAHRAAYEHCIGPIPDGHQIDHVKLAGCIWRDCVNVNGHLEAVTPRENTMRGCSFAAVNAAKTRCSVCGTPYDETNTYEYRGARNCRTCNRSAVSRYKGRLKAKATAEARLAEVADAWDALANFGRAA